MWTGAPASASTNRAAPAHTPITLSPAITSYSPDSGAIGDGITNSNQLRLIGSAEANSTVTLFDGTVQIGTVIANSSGTWGFVTGTLSDGTHSFTAKDTDASGNISVASSALTVTVDTVAPNAPVITGDTIVNTNEVNLIGTAEANSTVALFDGTTELSTATVNASGAWSFTTGPLTNGTHVFTATDTDAAGNTSPASQSVDPTISMILPPAPSIVSFSPDTGQIGDGVTDASVLTLAGSAEANSTVAIFDGKTELGTTTVNGNGTWSFSTGTLANGAHTFTATDTDTAGNRSAASVAFAVTVDTVPPNAPVITSDSIVNANEVLLAGTAEANSTVNVFDGTTQLGTATVNSSGAWTFTTGQLSNGEHIFTSTATDAAGNTSAASQPIDPAINSTGSSTTTTAITAAVLSAETPVIIDSVNVGDWGTYNLADGPYWAQMGIWNPDTVDFSGISFTEGSTTVTGFSSTAGILPGMSIYTWPDAVDTPWPTVVSVSTNSIVISEPASGTFTNEGVTFGLANDGVMYDQTIASYPSTFPDGTVITWSFPDQPNNAFVYSYPDIVYGSDPYHSIPTNTVTPLQVGSIYNLSVTYNISVNAVAGDYDCLIETFATSVPYSAQNYSSPIGSSYFTNEIGFLAHTPAELSDYILSLPNHFDFSVDGFNAYIATRPGTEGTSSPPYTLIMPVTAPGGTTPLDMISGTYTVPLDSILAALVAHGILSSNSYIDDYQFGFEVVQGSGSATINSLSYDWNNGTPNILSPTITSYSPDSGVIGDGITNATTLTLIGTAAAGSTVTVFDGTTQLGTATVNASGAWSFTTGTLANGAHSFTATDTDTAGDISAASAALAVTVDTVPPNAPIIASDTIINANEVNLTGTAEANSTVNVFDGTTELGTALVSASGAWSFTTGALADGSHAFTATDTDAAGNTSLASQAVDPTIAPPAAPTIASFSPDTGKVGDGITDAAVLTLTGTAEANSTVAVFDGKMELGTATVNSSGAWSFTTGTLANGAHTFTTTDTDAAGTSAASSALAVTVDTTPPTPAFDNLVHTSNGTVTLSGTSEANSTVSIYDGTTDLGTVTTAANGTWNFTTGKLSTAIQSFTLKAVDVAGNVGSGSNIALYGPASHETINVGPTHDLVTVLGGSDTFVFGSSLGNDVITGFQATGSSHDVLQFSHNTFSNFAAVLAHAAQVGSNVVITVDAADTVTLTNVHLSSLQKNDIHIV